MRTIPGFEDYIEPVQDILNDLFVPTLFGEEEPRCAFKPILSTTKRRRSWNTAGEGGNATSAYIINFNH